MVAVDCGDVLEAGDRPEAAKHVVFAPVNRIFSSESRKVGPPRVLLIEGRVADINRF